MSIQDWLHRRNRQIFWCQIKVCSEIGIVSCDLNLLREAADLIITLLLDVFDLFASVESFTYLLKVILHHIQILIIVFHVHSRVSNQKHAIFVEDISDLFAFGHRFLTDRLWVSRAIEVRLQVNYWNVSVQFFSFRDFRL